MKKKKLLFIDRDGTLIQEPPGTFQVNTLDELVFLPGVIRNLYRISKELDYEFIMVTNQDGLGTASYAEEDFNRVQDKMLEILSNEGITFSAIHIDRTFAHEGKDTRKPGIGMLKEYLDEQYDLANSFVIGDRHTDVQLAKNLGTKVVFIKNYDRVHDIIGACDCVTTLWDDIYEFLKANNRSVVHSRNTNETKIQVGLRLDGDGISKISTGLGFFDHMLDQIARHGGLDLDVAVQGDLQVDEHHTIEDTGLALGEAFAQAIGDKRGMERYGYCLPMDDCLAQVAIDFGGRPWIVWEADFKREYVGDMPTEMFFHFFKSFSDAAKCNLNIKAEGTNEHHKIESIFKAFARAIKMAVKVEAGNLNLPTTKGVL